MSLTYCSECNSVEGSVIFADEDEDQEFPMCGECESEEGLANIPEHDDFDMER